MKLRGVGDLPPATTQGTPRHCRLAITLDPAWGR